MLFVQPGLVDAFVLQQFVVVEEQFDLALCGARLRVGAVDDVPAEVEPEVAADGARRRSGG